MKNLLLQDAELKVEKTSFGTWRRFMYENGGVFAEFSSHATVLGMPLLHYTWGRNPHTGRRVVARGIIAVGRLACGVVAIGQAALGVIAVGQLGIGLALGLGQAAFGIAALGQLAVGVSFGMGQVATGTIAIGQFCMGRCVLAQWGLGQEVWSVSRQDPEAVEFFKALLARFTGNG